MHPKANLCDWRACYPYFRYLYSMFRFCFKTCDTSNISRNL